jgi:5S rRNA maturation endonuclease (ribonuclease M5)
MAVGLEVTDLFADDRRPRGEAAVYDYVDEEGQLLFQTVRMEPKDFRQRRPDGIGGWHWNLQGVQRVLYRLPVVLDAVANGTPVYVVEGEKDADAINSVEDFKGVATCNPMGAGKWRPEHTETLRGAHVVVVADRDEPGRKHAQDVARSLDGVAASVRVVEAKSGKDAYDHLTAGHTLDSLVTVVDAPASTLRVLDLADALEREDEPIPWTIEGWLAHPERIILGAEPKTGKSLLALDLALALAAGTQWLGFPAHGGPRRVLYVDEENGEHLVRRRVRKLAAGRGLSAADVRDVPLRYLSRNALNLDVDERLQALFGFVRDFRPDLVVLDSLVRFHRRDENSAGEMAAFTGDALDPLTQHFGASVLGLHHLRKPSGQANGNGGGDLLHRLRGSGDLAAWPDAVWGLERGEDGTATLSYLVGRWGDYPDKLAVTFHDSEDGRTLTFSAVGIEADAGRILAEAIREAGPIGVLRADLVKRLETEGFKAAKALATRHLGRLHGVEHVRRSMEGKSARYWTATFAPTDAT